MIKLLRVLARMTLSLAALCMMLTDTAKAQDGEAWTLVERATVSFPPQEAFFLIESAGHKARLKALQIEAPVTASDGVTKQWLFGARAHIAAGVRRVQYSLVVVGPQLEFHFTPAREIDADRRAEFVRGVDDLRDDVVQRKTVLGSFAVQVQAQDEAIRRLRDDAELIANFGRVIEVNDEIEQTKTNIENAEKDNETLLLQLKALGSGALPAPRNAVLREQQLTQQLGELAEAARSAESAEGGRKGTVHAELQSKLALVEATRFDDLDELKNELAELRRERATLEPQRAPDNGGE